MDVVASIGAVVGLVFNFAKAIKICHDIKGRYEGVDETVASIKDELETLQGALKQLMALMVNDAEALSSRWDEEKHLPQTFAGAMKGFERTIQILLDDLKGLHSSVRDGGKEMGKGKKTAFVWNEVGLNGHCVQLRSQAAALHLLLGVLQTGSISTLKTDLNELKVLLEKISLASNSVPDEPPVYTAQTTPTVHLIDYADDLMDFEKLYPVDSPPAIQSVYGEVLHQNLTPNTTGESSKSRSRWKGGDGGEVTGLGIWHQATSPIEYSYLPDKFDEFGPLPKTPLDFRSPPVQHRPQLANDLFESSKSTPIATLKPGKKSQILPQLTVEQPNTPPQSPILTDKKKPAREKISRLPSSPSIANQTPEMQAISRRLADLREQASNREVPPDMIRAVAMGDIKTVTRLLNSKHNIESRHPTTDATPLILAASLGNFEMLELLLDNDADTSAMDCVGRTALHYAASEDFPECTELLLAYGANPNIEDQEIETPLHRAVRYLRSDTVEVLLGWSKHPLRQRNGRSQTALHLAARNRGLDIIEKICERVKIVQHVDAEKCASSGEGACSCPMVYEGVETEDDLGDTALQSALFRRSMDAVSFLLKYTPEGANKPQRVKHWSSTRLEAGESMAWERPLHYAMRGSSKTLAKRLLDAGADVELKNSEGKTPLQVAVEKKNLGGIRLLLEALQKIGPASLSLVAMGIVGDITGEEFKEMFREDEVFDLAVGGLGIVLLRQALKQRKWGKVKAILAKCGGEMEKEKIGKVLDEEKALKFILSSRGSPHDDNARVEMMELLLAHGADVGVKIHLAENKWCYSLHRVVEENNIPLVDVLVKHGANLLDEDSHGRIPFHSAVIVSNAATLSHLQTLTATAISLLPLEEQAVKLKRVSQAAQIGAIRINSLPKLTNLLPPHPTVPALFLLAQAICYGRAEITEYLLERGCEAGAFKRKGYELKFASKACDDKGGCLAPGSHACNDVRDFEYCKWLAEVPGERKEKEMKRKWTGTWKKLGGEMVKG